MEQEDDGEEQPPAQIEMDEEFEVEGEAVPS
jgi:hypothetical protein